MTAAQSTSIPQQAQPRSVWYKPYDHARDYAQHARAYLSWEVALVEQIKREPAVRFRAYD